jgi:hypothetical protein
MEQGKENLEDLAGRAGLTVDEVRVFKCLRNARNLYHTLPDDHDKNLGNWDFHIDALFRMLIWRVVKRDHPQGWRSIGKEPDKVEGA